MKDVINQNVDNTSWINAGENRRTGYEAEAETAAFHNCTLAAGFAYVYEDASEEYLASESAIHGKDDSFSAHLLFSYDFMGLQARLFGRYIWFNNLWQKNPTSGGNDTIWDLALTKKVITRDSSSIDVFLSLHNVFNGSQYWDIDYMNPRRWIECGLRIHF